MCLSWYLLTWDHNPSAPFMFFSNKSLMVPMMAELLAAVPVPLVFSRSVKAPATDFKWGSATSACGRLVADCRDGRWEGAAFFRGEAE